MTWLRSLSGYQRLGLAMVLGLLALITLGGTVRVTDSGLACPDWPLCNGELFPGGDYHIWIEWTHRLVASVMGFVIVAFVIGAVLKHRQRRWVVLPALLGIVALGVQVVLGGLTVTEELPAEIVSAHLGTALIIVLLMLAAWLATFVPAAAPRPAAATGRRERRFAAATVVAALGLLALMVLGSYVSGSNAGFFCDGDWPLCNGSLLPQSGLANVQVAHRYLAAFEGLLLIALWVLAFQLRPAGTGRFRLATLVAALFGVQVALGAAMMGTGLADWTRIAHLAVAATTWAAMVTLTVLALHRAGWLLPAQEGASVATGMSWRFHLRGTQSSD
ncbi:MAG: COX15/CtaA family protein [Dehalococcoidia bacterium]